MLAIYLDKEDAMGVNYFNSLIKASVRDSADDLISPYTLHTRDINDHFSRGWVCQESEEDGRYYVKRLRRKG